MRLGKYFKVEKDAPACIPKSIRDYVDNADSRNNPLINAARGRDIDGTNPDEVSYYPGIEYQRLFNFLMDEGFIALQGDMDEIIRIVHEDFPK